MDKTVIAALKRNDRREMTAAIFELHGATEAAEMIKATSRITTALIDKAVAMMSAPVFSDEQGDPELAEAIAEPSKVHVDDGFDNIREAIAAGKRKKANKLFKAARESGARGGVLSALKTEIKGMK